MARKYSQVILMMILIISGIIGLITPCAADLHIQASSNDVLAKGDPITITGDGYGNGSVMVWRIGPSFFDAIVVETNPDGHFTYKAEDTEKYRSGPFMVIVQDPGGDEKYSLNVIESVKRYKVNLADGRQILEVDPEFMDIPAVSDSAERLINQILDMDTDDSCIHHTVYVEEPVLHVLNEEQTPLIIPNGECLKLQGTMNMAPDNHIIVRLYDTSVIERSGQRILAIPTTTVLTESGIQENYWEHTLDTSVMTPGEYLIEIGWNRSSISGQNAIILRVIEEGKKETGIAKSHGMAGIFEGFFPHLSYDSNHFHKYSFHNLIHPGTGCAPPHPSQPRSS